MAVTGALLPEGTRVRIRRGPLPLDPAAIGREGTIVESSEYHAHRYGVLLDGDAEARFFTPEELEVIDAPALSPAREEAKQRRALP
ncbi:MAG: hypothetical protein FWJ74_00170 [Gemmatimonadota bacterium]